MRLITVAKFVRVMRTSSPSMCIFLPHSSVKIIRNYSRVLSFKAQNVAALSNRPQDEVAPMSSRFSTFW
jgi:hypothetical protein